MDVRESFFRAIDKQEHTFLLSEEQHRVHAMTATWHGGDLWETVNWVRLLGSLDRSGVPWTIVKSLVVVCRLVEAHAGGPRPLERRPRNTTSEPTKHSCRIENDAWFTTECETPSIRRFFEPTRHFQALKPVYARACKDCVRQSSVDYAD